ncbi:hypothetical protein [Eubacterium ramulus]
MAALEKESKLYKDLSDLFDNNKDAITLDIYKKAVKIAREYEKEEIHYVLFTLKYVHSDIETGFSGIDKCLNATMNTVSSLTGAQYKLAFIYSVLETV